MRDKRLDRRLIGTAVKLTAQPTAPINQACEDWAATKASHRLFDNDKATVEKILEPHQLQAQERMKRHPPPWRSKLPDKDPLPAVTVHVVLAQEVDPPAAGANMQVLQHYLYFTPSESLLPVYTNRAESRYVRFLPLCVLSLVIVTVLLCSCGKAKTAESGTPVAGQDVAALTVSAKGADTPTAVSAKAAATPTLTQVRQTNAPTAAHTPRPVGTPPPMGTPGPTGTPTPTSTHVPPTPTPPLRLGPVVYVVRAGDSLAAIARAYGVMVTAIAEANGIRDANTIHVGQELLIPDPARVPAGTVVQSRPPVGDSGRAAAAPLPTPEQLPDTDPGPPFTVEISLNRVTPDPLLEKSRTYLVTGIVRNDGNETYAVSDILVTFYDAEGFRGVFEPAIREGRIVGGEWHWHGETKAEFAALFLAPGEEWPFLVAIVGQDLASFLVHPDAAPTGRESAPVELRGVQMVDTGMNYVRIRGTATNANPFEVKNVIVSGVLLDAGGQIVSIGSSFGLEEDIAPGASVRFDMRVEKEPYVRYQLYAQAERDWD